MILYYILTYFAIRSLQLLCKGRLVNTLGVNLSSEPYDQGDESAPFIATFPDPLTALGGVQDGNGADATNQIVQSGSNSDGSWVKYADGTMICYGFETITFNISNSMSALYRSGTALITFPQAFTGTRYISTEAANTSNGVWMGSARQITNSDFRTIAIGDGNFGNTGVDVFWVCIGRWK